VFVFENAYKMLENSRLITPVTRICVAVSTMKL